MARRSFAGRPDEPPVFIHGFATANPPHTFSQDEIRDLMAESARIEAPRLRRLLRVFSTTGVKNRHAALPLAELRRLRTWPARNACFVECAEILLTKANRRAIVDSGLRPEDIDFIVSVTTTGTDVPDVSARQIGLLGLRPDVRRIPIYGFGCAGGAAGLAHAALIARAYPGSNVLLQAIELCMTHLDPDTACDTHLIASALFGDGAASLVMNTEGPGLFSIGSTCQQIIPNTRRVMAWATGHTSLDMVLDVAVPAIVESQIGPVVQSFLRQAGRGLDDFGTIAAHPGSLKVIEAIETALALPKETLGDSRAILEQYGNMSSATVFFIMQNAMQRGAGGPFLMSGIGPGMTVALVEGDIRENGSAGPGTRRHRMTQPARMDWPTAT